MKLLQLTLSNYQGLPRYQLSTHGKSVNIYGDNGAGKSTIANAVTWILFDKPYSGEKGYSPKTTDADGNDVHHLEHSAAAIFEQENGAQITLKRIYKEIWKKKRGSNNEEFSGHITENFIDGVPVSAAEYKRKIEEICAPDRAKILISPRFFAENLHWEERRKILLEVCGDVSDAEIIRANDRLKDLYAYLRKAGTADQHYSVEEYKKIAANQKAKINAQLALIPARIEEAQKAIPDAALMASHEETERAIKALTAERTKLQEEMAQLSTSSAVQAMREEVAAIRAQIAEGKANAQEEWLAQTAITRKFIADIEADGEEINRNIERDKRRALELQAEIVDLEAKREGLLRVFREVKARQWCGDTVCSACGQALPADKLDEAKARFNQERSAELEKINAQGAMCSKGVIERKQTEISDLMQNIERREKAAQAIAEKMAEAKAEMQAQPDYTASEEYAELSARMGEIERRISDASHSASEAKRALQEKIANADAQIEQHRTVLIEWKNAERQKARIAELENEEKQLSKEYEYIERGIWLCEEFTRAKVNTLDERINSRFTNVRFRLFEAQINGGLKEDCTVLVPTTTGLTPWGSANHAAQIIAGCEIADILGAHWGVSLPLIMDNAESCTKEIQTKAQQIRLYVSAKDKMLRAVEV